MALLSAFENIIWGPAMLVCLVGAGLYLTFGLGFIQFRKLGYAFGELKRGHVKDEENGDITPFNALMTALSGTVGTGNIVWGGNRNIHWWTRGVILYVGDCLIRHGNQIFRMSAWCGISRKNA